MNSRPVGRRWRTGGAVAIAVWLWAAPAFAAAGEPPAATFRVGHWASQRGWLYSAVWPDASCGDVVTDGILDFRPAVIVPATATRVRIVFRAPERPSRVGIDDYPRVKRVHGDPFTRREPVGHDRSIVPRLSPRLDGSGNVIAWRAFFGLHGERDHYLLIGADWSSVGACGGGHAAYTFHARGVAAG